MFKIALVLAAVLVVLGISGGLLVGVANAAAPGDILYGLDRGMENLRLALTTQPASQESLNMNLAQERVSELGQLTAQGDLQNLDAALDNLSLALASVSPDQAVELDKQVDQALQGGNYPGKGPKNKSKDQNNANNQTLVDDPEDEEGDGEGEETDPEDEPDGEDTETEDETFKQPKQSPHCDGTAEKNHPEGDKLAEEYEVTYDEIMDWFCQGYGFGEIKLAYHISQEAGVGVDEVFAMRAEGKGWGQIMKEYDLIGKDRDKEKDKEKGNKNNDKGKGNKKP